MNSSCNIDENLQNIVKHRKKSNPIYNMLQNYSLSNTNINNTDKNDIFSLNDFSCNIETEKNKKKIRKSSFSNIFQKSINKHKESLLSSNKETELNFKIKNMFHSNNNNKHIKRKSIDNYFDLNLEDEIYKKINLNDQDEFLAYNTVINQLEKDNVDKFKKIEVSIQHVSDKDSNSKETSPNFNKNISPLMVYLPFQEMQKESTLDFNCINLEDEEKSNINKKMSINNFSIIKQIGSGSYSNVYLCNSKNMKDSKKYAVKIMDKKDLSEKGVLNDIIKEKVFLTKYFHKNIIKLYSSFQNKNKFFLLLEYAEKGDLSHYLGNSSSNLDLNFHIFIMSQILNGVKFLHDNNICHRDLKPENFLLTSNMILKICDFNSIINVNKVNNTDFESIFEKQEGTPEYLCKEVYNKSINNLYKIDSWSLGIIFYKLFHGKSPFIGTTNEETKNKVLSYINTDQLNISKTLHPLVIDLISSLLHPDQDRRIGCYGDRKFSISKIMQHPIFSNVNFKDIQFNGFKSNSKYKYLLNYF